VPCVKYLTLGLPNSVPHSEEVCQIIVSVRTEDTHKTKSTRIEGMLQKKNTL
jgi:hypothetical protein